MHPPSLPGADLPICQECVSELLDPENRRYRYPFIRCSSCGPRFTSAIAPPFRRELTTQVAFPPCSTCLEEYETESDRRFSFDGISCPACGPKLIAVTRDARYLGEEALTRAIQWIREGRAVAVKATGGFHLAADATNEEAIASLRRRKNRPHKPFAVMARSLSHIERAAQLDEEDRKRLEGEERPIVLLPRRHGTVARSVAPSLSDLGFFLPSTALQRLLLDEGPPLQVMTSANLSGEPTAARDDDALRMLGNHADAVLFHERKIQNVADDSVVRSSSFGPIPIRRSRGFVPRSLPLPMEGPPLLAVGGQEKGVVCLASGGEAFLSPHLGDLDSPTSWARYMEAVETLQKFTGIVPEAIAHDLHMDYRTTRWALESGLPRIPVQHHHAHIAACFGENVRDDPDGKNAPILGVAFDGTGLGADGRLWGGEFFLTDFQAFQRLGHLRSLPLPGGSLAIRQPFRLALAALLDAGESIDVLRHAPPIVHDLAGRLLAGHPYPHSNGAGRWFDAVAAICGVALEVSYEGQAASELEALVSEGPTDAYGHVLEERGLAPFSVDLRHCIRGVAGDLRQGVPTSIISARFHETMAQVVEEGCIQARQRTGVSIVALAGGCFQNRVLVERATERLRGSGFEVLLPREVPQNDGGLSFGQAAIASTRLSAVHEAEA